MKKIDSFDGTYDWLSNFYPAKVFLDGVRFPTVENAYQAAKVPDPRERRAFCFCTPGVSKRYGRQVPRPADWDERRVVVMRSLLRQKFKLGAPLAEALEATGDAELIEGNTWGDVFWGVYEGVGANMLGRLLMEIREANRKAVEEMTDGQ